MAEVIFLKKKMGFDNSKMFIEKCKKIAELNFQIEKPQCEETQQFQANTEVPPKS